MMAQPVQGGVGHDRILEKGNPVLGRTVTGEDLIVRDILLHLGLAKPTYLDIGAYHPYYLSNTALLYLQGGRGINIEPNPAFFKEFYKYRKRDINLQMGISTRTGTDRFYRMSAKTMGTLSEQTASRMVSEGNLQARGVIEIQIDTVMNVIEKYWDGIFPDFLNIDVEGLEFDILRSIPYEQTQPKVICVETLSYTPSTNGEKNIQIIEYLRSQGYLHYADTHLNSIFVYDLDWMNRPSIKVSC